MVRFDDHADGPDGERLYENQTVLVMRLKWGRIVDQEDFYADTGRIRPSTGSSPSWESPRSRGSRPEPDEREEASLTAHRISRHGPRHARLRRRSAQ